MCLSKYAPMMLYVTFPFQFYHVWILNIADVKFESALFRLIFNRFPEMKHFYNLDNL